MFSSEGPHRFASGIAAGLALVLVAGLSLTWVVDPLGVLSPWGGGALCQPGAKVNDSLAQSALIIDVHRPREVILGSSRSMWMFAEAAAPGRANLGFSGATTDQVDQLARRAVISGRAARLWIGLDVGAFMDGRANPQLSPPESGRSPRASALLSGWLDPAVWPDAFYAMLTGRCADPTTTTLGFPRGSRPRSSPDHAILGSEQSQRRIMASRAPGAATALAQRRIGQLAELLRFARARGVTVVLFLAPSHPRYYALLHDAGLSSLHARWRASTLRLATRFGVVIVAADDPRFLAAATRGQCPPGRSVSDCAFFDVTHARPAIGNAIIAQGNSSVFGNSSSLAPR